MRDCRTGSLLIVCVKAALELQEYQEEEKIRCWAGKDLVRRLLVGYERVTEHWRLKSNSRFL